MENFLDLRIYQENARVIPRLEELSLSDLSPGGVVIRTAWSSVNYKDALAATGTAPILRRYPLVGGIDTAGHVESSDDARFRLGDPVLVTGCGLSEDHDGGYAELVRVPAEWVVPVPEGLTLFDAMCLGTAGLSASLAVSRMLQNGQAPSLGPILVTGATGGVGSFAIDLLSAQGFEVVALTGKADAIDYLTSLGASRTILRQATRMGQRALEKGLWGGAVDTVGGETLAWLTRTVRPGGSIASIGLAGGAELHTTVMPFIVRGISLLGVNSSTCPMLLRHTIWKRLGGDLRPQHLDKIVSGTLTLDELESFFPRMLKGETKGRWVVKIAGGL
jgi:acrylyl-CoA reductase (NADPH)